MNARIAGTTAAYWLNIAAETAGAVLLAALILVGGIALLAFLAALAGLAVAAVLGLLVLAGVVAVGVSPAVAAVLIFRREAVTFHFLDGTWPQPERREHRHERKD